MKKRNTIIYIFLLLLLLFLTGCVSVNDGRPMENPKVIANINDEFIKIQFLHFPGNESAESKAYSLLLEKAQEKYGDNVDVVNINAAGQFGGGTAVLLLFTGLVFGNIQHVTVSGQVVPLNNKYNSTDNTKPKVAIFNSSGIMDQNKIEIAMEMIIDAIVSDGSYSIVEREKIDLVLKEHQYQMTGMVSDKQVSKLGEQLGADFVCISTIKNLDTEYFVSIRLVDVSTALVHTSATSIGNVFYSTVEETVNEMLDK